MSTFRNYVKLNRYLEDLLGIKLEAGRASDATVLTQKNSPSLE